MGNWKKVFNLGLLLLFVITTLVYVVIHYYLGAADQVVKILLYILSISTLTVGEYLLLLMVFAVRKKNNEMKLLSWDYLVWLIPFAYSFYLTLTIKHNSLLIIFVGISTLVLLVLFIRSISRYIVKTNFGKKKTTFPIVALILLVIFFIFSCIFDDNIILFWPFMSLLIYFRYADYLQAKSDLPNRSQFYKEFVNDFRKAYNISQIFVLVLFFLFLMYIKGVWLFPNTISNLYTISITVFTFVLSVTTAFISISLKGRINKKKISYFRNAFIGFAEMCILFILVSLIGILIGLDTCSVGHFLTGEKLVNTLFKGDIILNFKMLSQILVLEIIILSFPLTLLYLYAMVKRVLKSL